MFDGYGVLAMSGDHLDISYRDADPWPDMTPQGSIKSFTFALGDEERGPVIQMGLITRLDSEPLDWAHVVDPPHYHGTDQFRVVSAGRWSLADKTLEAGSFAFQESGLRYREHPEGDDPAWIFLALGDRRGTKPTILRDADREQLINTGSANDRPLGGDEIYPHPAGPKGIAAIDTSLGKCQRGYLVARFDQLPVERGVASARGTFGDADVGPVTHMIRARGVEQLLPAAVCDTERLVLITSGSCRIGDRSYRAGDIRIQRGGTVMPEWQSGEDGVAATLLVADRRAPLSAFEPGQSLPAWAAVK